jgi:hypothetical protein
LLNQGRSGIWRSADKIDLVEPFTSTDMPLELGG